MMAATPWMDGVIKIIIYPFTTASCTTEFEYTQASLKKGGFFVLSPL